MTTFDDEKRARALDIVENYVADGLDGIIANAILLEQRPTDRDAAARMRIHFVELSRLIAVRDGLRDA